jgi:hypothetical protein
MFIVGAGIAMLGSYLGILTLGMQGAPANADSGEWKTVVIGEMVSFEIPTSCTLGSSPTFINVVCPTAKNDQPLPEFSFVIDGSTVNVRRYENLESPYWDHVVASMSVVQPMTRDITINIQE